MSKTNEQQGQSEEQSRSVRTYRTALQRSLRYVRPQFEKAVRMYRLWAGVMPPEIQTTFSQIMLWFAYATVDQELTYAMRQMMTNPDWLKLVPQEVQFERTANMATKWLRYQMEVQQEFQVRAIPAIQACYIFGNGYRWYKHGMNNKIKYDRVPNEGLMGVLDPEEPYTTQERIVRESVIAGSNLGYFNAFPSPAGHEINTPDSLSEERLDYFIAQFYPTKKFILNEVKRGNFDRLEAARLFDRSKNGSESQNDPSIEFKQAIIDESGHWKSFSAPDWITDMESEADNTDLNPRYRCGIMFEPDRWRIVAEDKYLLYDGKPLLNCTPIANFKCNQGQNEFFSLGVIEPVEDLLLSMIMNFDMRMDHLIGKFHPTKYIPQQLVDDVGGDLSRFDTKPYNIIPYQHNKYRRGGGLDGLIVTESGETLDQQAFLEQGQMKEYLEDVISQRSGRGMQSSTATVGSMLISDDVARSMLRAMTVDMTGIKDSAEITLKMGAKYITEDPLVRTGAAGIPWELIEFDAITDSYGVQISGARKLAMAEEMFKKQMSVAPLLLNDPQIAGQMELKRQLIEAGQFENSSVIMNGDSGAPRSPAEQMIAQPKQSAPGGAPTAQNDARSQMNRNTVDRAGEMVAAGNVGI